MTDLDYQTTDAVLGITTACAGIILGFGKSVLWLRKRKEDRRRRELERIVRDEVARVLDNLLRLRALGLDKPPDPPNDGAGPSGSTV